MRISDWSSDVCSSDLTINAIKQAAEFGIVESGQELAGLLVFLSDVHSLGLKTAQGLQLTTGFYWDMNDKTRAWSKRFGERNNGRMPTMVQAGEIGRASCRERVCKYV